MPQPLSFIKLRDAEYVDQFAGSVVPELKDAQKVLNERYDLAEENDSKRAAVAREMMQNVADKDKGQAQLAYKRAMDDIAANQARGDYENMYGKTANSARQFSVNAAKFIKEKQLMDAAWKDLSARKDISESQKEKIWNNNVMLANKPLTFNEKENVVEGEHFRPVNIAADIDALKTFSSYGEKMKADVDAGKNENYGYYTVEGKRVKSTDPGAILFHTANGKRVERVKEEDLKKMTEDIAAADPTFKDYTNRKIIQETGLLFKEIDEDPTLSPQERKLKKDALEQQVRADIKTNELDPATSAVMNIFGFHNIAKENRIDFDQFGALDLKGRSGSGSDNLEEPLNPQSVQGNTKQYGEEAPSYEDYTKEIVQKKEVENVKAKANFLKSSVLPAMVNDPITNELITKEEFFKRSDEKAQDNTHINPYQQPYQIALRKAYQNGTYDKFEKEFDTKNPKPKVRDLSIDEIVSTTKDPILTRFASENPDIKSGKELYEVYRDYKNKLRNVNTSDKLITDALVPATTNMVLGQLSGKDESATRNGGVFDNHSVIIKRNGKESIRYDTGLEAVKEGEITRKELAALSVTKRNSNYTGEKMAGPYLASGTVDDDELEVYVNPSLDIQDWESSLKVIEPLILTGVVQTTPPLIIDGKQAVVTIDPMGGLQVDKKAKKVGNIDPLIKIDIVGSGNDWVGTYSQYKNWLLTRGPYSNLTQNKNYMGNLQNKTAKSSTVTDIVTE